jgi:glycerophosphoryl diester phosphodiesterase
MIHSRQDLAVASGKASGYRPARRLRSLLLVIQLAIYLQATSEAAQVRALSIAHRGDNLFAPENTVAAFSPCLTKADMVEYDVEISSDGELVVIHGPDLDRTTDGTGSVQARTLAELRTLDAGSWFAPEFAGERIPTLAETISLLAPTTRSLIHAYSGTAEDYVRAIQRRNAKSSVILQSWDQTLIAAAHALDPDVKLGVVGQGPITTGVVTNLQAIGVNILAWASNDVNAAAVQTVHSLGAELFVWTVDGPGIQDFLDMGVDGIITDDPALARSLAATDLSTHAQMASEVVSYWQFDDGQSDEHSRTISDVEMRNPGSLQGPEGSPSWANGVDASFGGALYVDGTNSFVRIPRTDSLDLNTNRLSLSIWVRIDQKPSGLSTDFGGIFGSADDSYAVYLDRAAAELRFGVADRSGRVARPGIPEALLQTNTWHHVVGVYNGAAGTLAGQALIYLDGRLVDVHTGGDGADGLRLNAEVRAVGDAAIGRNGAGEADWLACTVDDVAIWRRALTSAEVRQIYAASLSGLPLQSQMAQLSVTQPSLSEDRQKWRFLGALAHGSLAGADLRLLVAENTQGPYSLATNISVRLIDGHHCEVVLPVGGPSPGQQFFRLVLPTIPLSAGFEDKWVGSSMLNWP